MEKASGGSFARTTRKTAEDEGRRRGGLGHDANRSLYQKVEQMSRVFQAQTLVGLRSKTSLNTYLTPGLSPAALAGQRPSS
jgi:hypothetical protein